MSFAEYLKTKYSADFKKATTHAFTTELCKGTLPDDKLLVYLIQDLKFFQVGIRLTCRAASLCDDNESQIKLAKQIGFFANDENDYFEICIKQLSEKFDADKLQYFNSLELPEVKHYIDSLRRLLEDPDATYRQIITATYLMEAVYLQWADDAINLGIIPANIEWKHKEWIDLHSGEGFSAWTEFLKQEVDRVGDETVESVFQEFCKLEFEFFDKCYHYNS
jgi:thiaminase